LLTNFSDFEVKLFCSLIIYIRYILLHFLIADNDLPHTFTAFLGDELTHYVEKTWPDGVVKIVRTTERSGLIRARLAGAKAATGDVLIFLDSHCEVGPQWWVICC
jgi:glycosyltransferase involved in cell wall biosynthesis